MNGLSIKFDKIYAKKIYFKMKFNERENWETNK